jgi:hypothetical protein
LVKERAAREQDQFQQLLNDTAASGNYSRQWIMLFGKTIDRTARISAGGYPVTSHQKAG